MSEGVLRSALAPAAIALISLAFFLSAGASLAAVIDVPDDYSTIQAAVNAAGVDDTVAVAAGTYFENNILINKGLTVQGSGIGSSFIDATASAATGSVVSINLTSGSVLLDGFTIKTGTSLNGVHAKSTSSGSTITISHNRIEGFGPTATGDNFGLIAGYGSVASLVFTYNEIFNCASNSILLELHVGPTDVSYNTFDRSHIDEASDAYFCMNYGGVDITTLQKVSHNVIDMGAGTVFTNDTRGTGITFTSSYTGVVGGFTNIEITDNVIYNLKPYRRGIGFWNNAPSGTSSGSVGDINAPTVARNTITSAAGYSGQFGIRLLGLVANASVVNNSVDGVDYGFAGQAYNTNLPVGAVVSGNSFVNIASYLDWQGSGTLDASANWWDTETASGVSAKLSGSVDYTPWLHSGSDTSGGPGFQGDFTALHVDDSSPQTGLVGRVQEGVDLVSGSTVYVEEGSYTEQVEIAKDITLDGAGAGTVIISPDVLTKYFVTSVNNYPVVYIHNATATVKDLVLDGAGKGNANRRFSGIAFRNAGGKVENCTIKGVRDTPFSGAQHGVALYAYNDDMVARSLTVWDNVMFDFQKNAMALNAGATTPLTVDVRRNTVTGAGATSVTAQNGIQVWADAGSGTVADNNVSGIGYSGTGWAASSILNYYTDLDVTSNTVTNGHMGYYNYDGEGVVSGNSVTVTRVGDGAWGILAVDPERVSPSPFDIELLGVSGMQAVTGGAAPMAVLGVDIIGNVVTYSGACTTYTYGIEADAGYGSDDIDLTIEGNTITKFDVGVGIYHCTSDCGTGVFTNVSANYNSIAANCTYGMESNVDYITVDATSNWWGDPSGPYHSSNPSGTGNAVSDNVQFDPWLGSENEVSVVPSSSLTNCTTPKTVTLYITRAGVPAEARGYEVVFDVDTTVVAVANPSGDIIEDTFLSSVGTTQFYATPNGAGTYTVSCVILGGDEGPTTGGPMFTVLLTPVAQGTSPITVVSVKLRDLENNPLSVSGVGGWVQVDCTYPTMEALVEVEGAWYNTAPSFSNFGFDDDVNLDVAEYRIDSGGWATVFSGIDAASWDSDGWVLPGFDGLSQGTHVVYFRVRDDAGNWNGEGGSQPNLYSWWFRKDTVAPEPPTGFVARPGHDKTHLTWTNPVGDPTLAGTELRFNGWLDYPEYMPPEPSYPGDHTQGTFVALTTGAAYDDNPRTPRDIYYYSAFSVDSAGNYSGLGTTAADRTTSYWLGDLDADGNVYTTDLVSFSSAFGASEGSAGWNNVCDFGPTDDWSSKGIPLPDNIVDFEDLMIFSMNWGNVLPSGVGRVIASVVSEDLARLVKLDVVWLSDTEVSVVMRNSASTMKGMHFVVDVVGAELVDVERGGAFDGNSQIFFGTTAAGSGVADVSVAILGDGVPLMGSGEVFRIHLKAYGDNPAGLFFRTVDLRDLVNEGSRLSVGSRHEAPFIPVVTVLGQNYPNPFNPLTFITYDLAKAGHVAVQVYDVTGRLVRTLVDESMAAGRYTVEWNGRDEAGVALPSGVYFCSMEAAGFSASQKMIMIR